MKILCITDKPGSAIDRLAIMNHQRNLHYRIVHFAIHPKKPDMATVAAFRKQLATADIIDAQYWKSLVTMIKLAPEILHKKIILTHHNEHNIEGDWEWKQYADKFAAIVVKNGWQKARLEAQGYKPVLIRHAYEDKNFTFTPELTQDRTVLYVGQIKKVKGVRELKQACDELGYNLMIVGGASEAAYWQALNKNNLMIMNNVPDGELGAIYAKARVFCCNSDDGTESGTLPILEAMASGIPVVTRRVGHTRDFGKHMKNLYIREGKYTDIEDLKTALKTVMENDDVCKELRENAWREVRRYHPDVQAREYDKLYRSVLSQGKPLVSIITPTYNQAKLLPEYFDALNNQTYKNFEVVLIDDGSDDNTVGVVEEAAAMYSFPIKFLSTGNTNTYHHPTLGEAYKTKKYGLAQARNMGLIEAIGKIVVFCDDRLHMEQSAVEELVNALQREAQTKGKNVWVWGSKGQFKTFVENFSATWRGSVIKGGMFNERMDEYGGMTQEVSRRFAAQGFHFVWCAGALAIPMASNHSRSRKRKEIVRSKIKLYKLGF